jgi:hypothetical protein
MRGASRADIERDDALNVSGKPSGIEITKNTILPAASSGRLYLLYRPLPWCENRPTIFLSGWTSRRDKFPIGWRGGGRSVSTGCGPPVQGKRFLGDPLGGSA